MCFDADSRPPALPTDLALPVLAGGTPAERLELTSADGARFAAALAEAPDSSRTAVVILPDLRGLYRFYVELAERFAQAGHHAIAIDLFGRTAGTGEREAEWEFRPHVLETTLENVHADIAAAIAVLRERAGAERVATVGFCFGGEHSYFATTNRDLGLDRAVAFYGGLRGDRVGLPDPVDHAAQMHGPMLALFGGADQGIPLELVDAFDAALTEHGVEHDFHVYPGAPHSFFDRKYDEHAEACADAWRRVLAFLA